MILTAFLLFFLLLLVLLFISFRISIELIANETGITYTIKGNILKVIKVFEVKNGREGKKKRWTTDRQEKGALRKKFLGIIKTAIDDRRGKIFHIEKLSLTGSFSLNDAAANAILYGFFLTLWQFLLIFLAANFRLEHQNYNFLPDFQHDRNEMIFHAIFRVVIVNMVLLLIHNLRKVKQKK